MVQYYDEEEVKNQTPSSSSHSRRTLFYNIFLISTSCRNQTLVVCVCVCVCVCVSTHYIEDAKKFSNNPH